MNARQTKNKLMDIGKTVADLARELCEEFPGTTEKSMYSMLDNMIWGRNFYPRYAEYLNARYGFHFVRPAHLRPVRELLKRAA